MKILSRNKQLTYLQAISILAFLTVNILFMGFPDDEVILECEYANVGDECQDGYCNEYFSGELFCDKSLTDSNSEAAIDDAYGSEPNDSTAGTANDEYEEEYNYEEEPGTANDDYPTLIPTCSTKVVGAYTYCYTNKSPTESKLTSKLNGRTCRLGTDNKCHFFK